MNYDNATMKVLTDMLSSKIGEKYLAKEIIQMKMELEDDEIITECIKRFEENLEENEKQNFDNLGKEISRYPNLTTGFINRHLDLIDWDILAIEQRLPESFWMNHKNIIPAWGMILEFQDLTEEALKELDEILQKSCTCNTREPCDNCQSDIEEYNNMDDHDAYYYGMPDEEIEIDFEHGQGMADW